MKMDGAEDQSRTDDTWIFSPLLYHLSYLGVPQNLPHSFVGVNVTYTWRSPDGTSRAYPPPGLVSGTPDAQSGHFSGA